jgi:hypothetical protein
MPTELVKALSKRHEQISAELERLEREEGKPRTGKLIQYVAHATRPAKTHETPESLHGRCRPRPASAASTPSGWSASSPAASASSPRTA